MPFNDVNPKELRRLTKVFQDAGADDPESWAYSQLAEGIPQLAIFSFSKALWQGVVDESDDKWIDIEIQNPPRRSDAPLAQIGPVLKEMLEKGVRRESIVDLVRAMQYLALYHACSLIDGSHMEDVPITDWTLHQTDDEGNPIAVIQGLHEVLLGMDPTGREMRPRKGMSAEPDVG